MMNLRTWIVWNSALEIFDVSCTWRLRVWSNSNSFDLRCPFPRTSRRNLRRWSCVLIDVLQRHLSNCCFGTSWRSSNKSSLSLLVHKLRIVRNVLFVLIHKNEFLFWHNLRSYSNITNWRQRVVLAIVFNAILLFQILDISFFHL